MWGEKRVLNNGETTNKDDYKMGDCVLITKHPFLYLMVRLLTKMDSRAFLKTTTTVYGEI